MRDGPGKGHDGRTTLREHILKKKEEKRVFLNTVSSFEKHAKSKRNLGTVIKRPTQDEVDMELRNYRSASRSIMGTMTTEVMKPQPTTLTTATLGCEEPTRQTAAKSVFEAFNPMSRKAYRMGVDLDEEPGLGASPKRPSGPAKPTPNVNRFGQTQRQSKEATL